MSFIIFYENAKRRSIQKEEEPQPEFKLSDMKEFTFRFYMHVGLVLTTFAVYWIFLGMLIQFLEAKCGMTYEEAKNVLVCVPLINLGVIFITSAISKYMQNESKLMMVAGISTFVLMSLAPMYPYKMNAETGLVIIIIHAINGGIYAALY